jgi:hypothetical protein
MGFLSVGMPLPTENTSQKRIRQLTLNWKRGSHFLAVVSSSKHRILSFHCDQMNLPGGKGRPARKADNLIVICEPIV